MTGELAPEDVPNLAKVLTWIDERQHHSAAWVFFEGEKAYLQLSGNEDNLGITTEMWEFVKQYIDPAIGDPLNIFKLSEAGERFMMSFLFHREGKA